MNQTIRDILAEALDYDGLRRNRVSRHYVRVNLLRRVGGRLVSI
jgi:hypothetical protein